MYFVNERIINQFIWIGSFSSDSKYLATDCEKIRQHSYSLDAKFWRAQGKDDLTRMLKSVKYDGRAKNVIIFVGDGMGIQTHTMARIYKVTGFFQIHNLKLYEIFVR